MKFGICMDAVKALNGFPTRADFLEIPGNKIYFPEDDEFKRLAEAAKQQKLPIYSCNVLIDPSFRLTGPEVNFDALEAYCDKVFSRLARLGVKMVVFGSGKSKHVPEGFPMEKAWDQLVALGRLLSDKAALYGQTVVTEPLRYEEVNIINTVEEGDRYVKLVGRDNFRLLVDFYHFVSNGEDFSSLKQSKDLLKHAHFATPVERSVPRNEEEWVFFTACLKQLKTIGYRGDLVFEGKNYEAEELDTMLVKMKQIAEELGV